MRPQWEAASAIGLSTSASHCDGGEVDGIDDAARRKPPIGLRRERGPMGSWSRGPHRFEAVMYDATGHGWVLVHPEDRARGRVDSPSAYAEKWAVPRGVIPTRRHPS